MKVITRCVLHRAYLPQSILREFRLWVAARTGSDLSKLPPLQRPHTTQACLQFDLVHGPRAGSVGALGRRGSVGLLENMVGL